MERLSASIRDARQRPGTPPPAGRAATEDGGQRYEDDKSASDLSDEYPAGLPCIPVSESQRSGGSEARRYTGPHGGAGPDVPGAVPPSERRRVSLDVRLTVTERAAIRDRARVLGVKPSAWARAVMLDALDSRRGRTSRMHQVARSAPAPDQARAVEQLRRVGVNLNQVLRGGKAVDDSLLREVLAAVDDLRASLGDRTLA